MLTTDDVGDTAVTTPLTSVLERADSVIVAGWPTAIFVASASAKLATTSRLPRLSMVMKLDDEPELVDEPVPELADDPVLPVESEAVLDEPVEPEPVPGDDPVEPEPVLDEPVEAELAVEPEVGEPDPPTVSPTEPFTAVTVPVIEALRVVLARSLVSAVTVTWSWATVASSCEIVAGVTVRLAWLAWTVSCWAAMVD